MSPPPTGPPIFSGRGRAGVEERRAVGLSLAASLVLHLVTVGLSAALFGVVSPRMFVAAPWDQPSPLERITEIVLFPEPGTQAPVVSETTPAGVEPAERQPVQEQPAGDRVLAELPTVAVEDSAAVEDSVAQGVPSVGDRLAPGAGVSAGVPEATGEGGLTVAERLQPRMGDPRLWADIEKHFSELTELERAELLLHGMIRSWNDSVAVANALADRGRDWTYTDSEGRRWGLASGRLYLGDFSIPLAMEMAPGQLQNWAERQWISQDLMQGAAAAQIRETWSERARAIRERLEAERDAAAGRATTGGGGGGGG